MDEKVYDMFTRREIDFHVLANAFPKVEEYFKRTKPGKINEYDNGVMSTVIEGQGKDSPSTFGYLPKGEFVFNVGGNQETMHFLHGEIAWGVGKGDIVPAQYDELLIPAGKDLVLNVKKPTLYICDYLKQ